MNLIVFIECPRNRNPHVSADSAGLTWFKNVENLENVIHIRLIF